MSWGILDHAAFQRAALLLLGVGGALGALGSLSSPVPPGWVLALTVGAAALARVVLDDRRGLRQTVGALLGAAAGLALASVAWRALAEARPWDSWSLLEHATAGALFGLQAGLGLLPAHIGRISRDRVAAALARLDIEPLPGEEGKLVERAAAAHRRTRDGLARDPSASARELGEGAVTLTLQVIAYAGRCRELRRELAAVDPGELESRGETLTRAAGATDDRAAREDFARAARTAGEQSARLRGLHAAHDRLRARLYLQVTILESTALALSSRRASVLAQEAAALGPLAERVREAGGDLEAEALALAETAS